MKSSTITLNITLNNENHPHKIEWQSTDGENKNIPSECKAMLVSIFDKEHKDTFKIDLWTSEMQVSEMDRFMFQTLQSLSETYFNATKNDKLANAMMGFSEYFGEETGILTNTNTGEIQQ